MLAYLRTMPLVHPTLGVRTVYRIRVYDVQVEADIGRKPRFVEQKFADGNVPLVAIAQEGQISGNLVIQFYLALIIQFHDGKQRSRSLGQRSQNQKGPKNGQ